MAVQFPTLPGRSLGVGLDLPWDGRSGFGYDPDRGDRLTAPARQFLQTYAPSFSHAFFSWQPRDRGPARIEDYAPPWDDLWETLPEGLPCALHHTALNLGALGHYRRDAIFAFTNALCARYRLQWINEDVGLWSLAGRPVPYPLPPLLNDEGLRATIENVAECQAALVAPLVLEFPGFSRGVSVVLGDQHAYDFFRVLAEETESPVTLDVGHLLSYQWWRGLRGAALLDDLERLPLQHCFELHLSGSAIVEDRFIDAHHGVLLEEQLVLLDRLLPLCPALRAVTFEDPRFDPQGRILPSSERSWRLLAERTASWRTQRSTALAARLYAPMTRGRQTPADPLFASLREEELEIAAATIQQMVRDRTHRGTGGLMEWYPGTIRDWRAENPEDARLEKLTARFCASPAAAAWREAPSGVLGISIEEAFYRFFLDAEVGDPLLCEEEFLGALVRGLAVTPEAQFRWPKVLREAPGGCQAVTRRGVLHAAIDGRYLHGPVTPLVAALLSREPLEDVMRRHSLTLTTMGPVLESLRAMALLP